MNMYEEALDVTVKYHKCHDCLYEYEGEFCKGTICYKYVKTMEELVEKATPKKPIKKTPKNRERPYCADCGLRLKKTWIACPRCATMIDWSEDTKIL